jgi:hypothetical protein
VAAPASVKGDSNAMLAKKVIVSSVFAAALFAGTRTTVKSETLDSGIFGVFPDHALVVQSQRRQVDELANELATVPDPDHRVRQALDRVRGVLDEMQSRCVLAFDRESEVPAAYPWFASDLWGVTGIGSCSDGTRFPSGFMKLMSAGPCSKDGSFRLPLAPGHYAVFVGMTPGAAGGASSWWQYVDIVPHQWLHLVSPKGDIGTTCTSDADCLRGAMRCRENPLGPGAPHYCSLGPRSQPPPVYDSGVRGRIGAPSNRCYGNPPAVPPPQEHQCIEAFREGATDMAACAGCRIGDGEFALPLAPGRYVLEIGQESRTVEVTSGQWSELYLQGAKPGAVQFPSCGLVQ